MSTLDDLIAIQMARQLSATASMSRVSRSTSLPASPNRCAHSPLSKYLPPAHTAALAALELVDRLGAAAGGYLDLYSPIETMRFASERWIDADKLVRLLERFRPLGRSGDVYAILRQSRRDAGGDSGAQWLRPGP